MGINSIKMKHKLMIGL